MTEPTRHGEFVSVEVEDAVATIRIDRAKALNALNSDIQKSLAAAAEQVTLDDDVRAVILYGGEKTFAAGADIKEMASKSYADMFLSDWFADWDEFALLRTPVVAAVAGYALGGGCELAMMCDLLIAADSAKFGQPEINLGVIPGGGGTQVRPPPPLPFLFLHSPTPLATRPRHRQITHHGAHVDRAKLHRRRSGRLGPRLARLRRRPRRRARRCGHDRVQERHCRAGGEGGRQRRVRGHPRRGPPV